MSPEEFVPLLAECLSGTTPFALLQRPESGPGEGIELLLGTVSERTTTAELPALAPAVDAHALLAIVPYRAIGERGFAHHDDGAPVLCLAVDRQTRLPVDRLRAAIADWPIEVGPGEFDIDDTAYAELVHRVLAEEIGHGAGANFVLRRTWQCEVTNWSVRTAVAYFVRLLAGETGAYWTFLVHTGGRTFIGASPERQVSLADGTAAMTPISGTYRYPAEGPTVSGVLDFLADGKETNELYMVLDEELKMMCRICPEPYVHGPRLKEMARLAHTEYRIAGDCDRDYREVLRETLLAPTVTGSPLENACRVITRFEPTGRGYYAGVLALAGRDERGCPRMDSAIMIRTAEVDGAGRLRIGVGATLVRDSDPATESRETRAKAAGLLDALHNRARTATTRELGADPAVQQALSDRNGLLATLWLRPTAVARPHAGRRILIVDAEDTFTAMGARLLRALGLDVTVHPCREPVEPHRYDLVVMGPGPGDPRDLSDPKIARLHALTRTLLDGPVPFFSVCLSHQVLSTQLGLQVARCPVPNQGVARRVELFGTPESVYFYNTFQARHDDAVYWSRRRSGPIEVCRDPHTGAVHALRGNGFASVQFHPASVMTTNGSAIVDRLITPLLLGEPVGSAAADYSMS
ncbi:anthranilate synthase family protein [Nocardia sp. NPDC005998]|uniref:anthranilate synthase family protein n=1 Tax=Nocardia sp. NPDC005998 TaxID=3156894 RepID=UPI0033BA839E